MNKKLLTSISFCVFTIFFLAGCGTFVRSSIGPCTEPNFKLAYPVDATAIPGAYPKKQILPSGNWKIEATIPGSVPIHVNSLIMRDNNEVWVVVEQDLVGVYRYRIDKHQWTSYATENATTIPHFLISGPHNALWGAVSTQHISLMRYNEQLDQFQAIKDSEGLLSTLSSPRTPPIIQVDALGNLWMILQKKNEYAGLYRFEPRTEKLERRLPNVGLSPYSSLTISPDGKIWVFDPYLESGLIKYDPMLDKAENIYSKDWDIQDWVGDLYFDRSGNLWSGVDGWLDLSSLPYVWHKILPSPVFITDYFDGEDQFRLAYPSDFYQSKNDWYWFSFPEIGIVRLDPQTATWCRFTTAYSPVVEDEQGNIRIIADNKIYLYKTR